MTSPPSSAPRVRFGVFELDTASGELRRNGTLVRLQPQPAAVLRTLVARAGSVVTRDELRQAVWGPTTFVDFDSGLNFCVAQIRSALGDTADAPRFIRTLPKRGYQFVAPVEATGSEASGSGDRRLAPPAPGVVLAPEPAATPHMRRTSRTVVAAAICAAAAIAVAAGVWWTSSAATDAPGVEPVVAVALFDADSRASDAVGFAQGLTDALVAELTTSGEGRYAVIGNAAILRSARTFRDLRAIDLALHVQYVVLGSVQRDGDRIRVLAHLIRLPEQTHVTVARLDRTAGDPLSTQAELAQAIAARFSPRVEAGRPLGRPRPSSLAPSD